MGIINYLKNAGYALITTAALALGTANVEAAPVPKRETIPNIGQRYNRLDKRYRRIIGGIDAQLEHHNDRDKIDLEILVDKEYIQIHTARGENWWEEVQQTIEDVSRKFDVTFGVKFEIDSVRYMKLGNTNDAHFMFRQLHLDHSIEGREDIDAVIAFTGKEAIGILGVADRMGQYAIIATTTQEQHVVQHEFSHWFDADDYDISHPLFTDMCVMSYLTGSSTNNWSWQAQDRIRRGVKKRAPDGTYIWKFDGAFYNRLVDYINSFDDYKIRRRVMSSMLKSGKRTKTEQDLEYVTNLIQDIPNDSQLRMYRADILKGLDRNEDVMSEYSRILRLNPDASILNSIAWNYIDGLKGDTKDAIRIARKAVRKAPRAGYIVDTLGWAYFKDGNLDQAERWLVRAYKLDNDHEEILEHLIEVYQTKGEFENWNNAYKELLELDPNEGYYFRNYARDFIEHFSEQKDQYKDEILESARRANHLYPDTQSIVRVLRDAYGLHGIEFKFEKRKEHKRLGPF